MYYKSQQISAPWRQIIQGQEEHGLNDIDSLIITPQWKAGVGQSLSVLNQDYERAKGP